MNDLLIVWGWLVLFFVGPALFMLAYGALHRLWDIAALGAVLACAVMLLGLAGTARADIAVVPCPSGFDAVEQVLSKSEFVTVTGTRCVRQEMRT